MQAIIKKSIKATSKNSAFYEIELIAKRTFACFAFFRRCLQKINRRNSGHVLFKILR